MAWIRLDDGFSEHRKVLALSPLALRAHIFALCYCARTRSDGHIPGPALKSLQATRRHAAELVAAGMWEVEEGGGWAIHDYLKYQRSKAELDQDAKRMRDARAGGGHNGASDMGTFTERPVNVPQASGERSVNVERPTPRPTPTSQRSAIGRSVEQRRSA
jgi:hypothetical protein